MIKVIGLISNAGLVHFLNFNAPGIRLTGSSRVGSVTFGDGDGADVNIKADFVEIIGQPNDFFTVQISSAALGGRGNAGNRASAFKSA